MDVGQRGVLIDLVRLVLILSYRVQDSLLGLQALFCSCIRLSDHVEWLVLRSQKNVSLIVLLHLLVLAPELRPLPIFLTRKVPILAQLLMFFHSIQIDFDFVLRILPNCTSLMRIREPFTLN